MPHAYTQRCLRDRRTLFCSGIRLMRRRVNPPPACRRIRTLMRAPARDVARVIGARCSSGVRSMRRRTNRHRPEGESERFRAPTGDAACAIGGRFFRRRSVDATTREPATSCGRRQTFSRAYTRRCLRDRRAILQAAFARCDDARTGTGLRANANLSARTDTGLRANANHRRAPTRDVACAIGGRFFNRHSLDAKTPEPPPARASPASAALPSA